jgi:sugar lactone lactonase YvrE
MKKISSILSVFCLVLSAPFFTHAQIITTIAGFGATGFAVATYGGDGGPATLANLNHAEGVTVDHSGNVYIADYFNHRVRKINPSGIITTIAGNGINGFSGDGGPATAAEIFYPMQVALDNSGNIYIVDAGNNRIRKVNTSGIITTIAGIDTFGYWGDGGQATNAALDYPNGVAVDGSGNVYIVDDANGVIRKVNTSGIISTVAGVYHESSYLGDGGPAIAGNMFNPREMAVDASGNLYIADEHINRIRKITTSGIITTIAGNGTSGYSGDGGPATAAELFYPFGVAVDAAGNVYIGDEGNARVRMVSVSGIITTIAGNGTPGYSGDGGLAVAAELDAPTGISVDSTGSVYIADEGNNRIRKIAPGSTSVNSVTGLPGNIGIYPNPVQSRLTIASSEIINQVTITNFLGQIIYAHEYNTEKVQIDVASLPASVYFIKINGSEVRKFVKE